MIVLDASAVVELLLHTPAGDVIAGRISDPAISLHVPHLIDVEVTQAMRRYAHSGLLDHDDATDAIYTLQTLDLQRHSHEPFLERMWSLRNQLTAYDATYVALAEALDTVVLTCDARLSRAPRIGKRIELVHVQRRPI